jgi:2',3'-cyclic-nucleotide 2'-phosphodiesterase (5'-nucleotidase family)
MPLNHLQSFGSFGNLLRVLQEEEEEKDQHQSHGQSQSRQQHTSSDRQQQQQQQQQQQLRSPKRSPRSGGRRPNKPNQPALDADDDGEDGVDGTEGKEQGVVVQAAEDVATGSAAASSAVYTARTVVSPQTGAVPTATGKKAWLKPSKPHEARLTVVQITDVYTLDNFASLKTMLETIRASQGPTDTVISMLTGDFLSPYLLSSIDRGQGMMDALAATPIDILIWGNHEADIDHRTVLKHVRNYPGTWINTNMQTYEGMDHQTPYTIVDIVSPDGTHRRKIGLVGVLSNDPKLYSHFKKPGAFGGARIDCPWDTLRKYQSLLEDEIGCDVVLPLEHLYVPEDHLTCRDFDFPVILSGHDHHRVDEIVDGTRLIKPGMDGIYATVLEMIWDTSDQSGKHPRIRSRFVKTSTFAPCPVLKAQTDSAYDVLLPLRNTELMRVPPRFEPLSSVNSRGSVTSMGVFICTLLRDALNARQQEQQEKDHDDDGSSESRFIDAVMLMGGNIRGGEAYDKGSFFSLEMLEAEIKADEIVGVVSMPGCVLAAGIEYTHAGDPRPGWMQYDEGIGEERDADGILRVTEVGGKPIEPERIYQVATKISDLGNGQSMPFKEYFTPRPELLPSKGSYFNIQTELMGYFARTLFHRLWDAIGKKIRPKMERVASSPMLRPTDVKAVQASPMLLPEATVIAGIPVQASPMLLSAAADIAGISESLLESIGGVSGSDTGGGIGGAGSALPKMTGPAQILKKVESGLRLSVLDSSGDGLVSVDEIHVALRDLLRLSTSDENMTLAKFVHDYADVTGNGRVTTEDFAHFCSVLPGGIGEYYSKVAEEEEEGKVNGAEGKSDEEDEEDDDEALMF